MLTLFVAMGLLERREDVFHVTPSAREHLCAHSPWFLGPYYASLKERPVCQDLLKVLRTGKPANWGSEKGKQDWHKSMETEEFAKQFTAAMDCRGVYLAQAVAKKINLTTRRSLLDIAGGSGIYACSLCAHFPNLRATVLEKPPVDKITAGAIAKRGFSDRVSVLASDMLSAPLPSGFDTHLYSNVLHDWDVPVVKQLLAEIICCVGAGRRVADPRCASERNEDRSAACRGIFHDADALDGRTVLRSRGDEGVICAKLDLGIFSSYPPPRREASSLPRSQLES